MATGPTSSAKRHFHLCELWKFYGSFMEVNAPWNTWGTFQNDLDDTRLTPAIFPAEPLIFWSAIPLANCPDEMRLTNTVSRRNIFCVSGAVDCSNGVESLLV